MTSQVSQRGSRWARLGCARGNHGTLEPWATVCQVTLDNKIIDPGDEVGQIAGKIKCRERLGGMLRYYYRAAA